jgi:hypothetical protein
MGAVIRDPQLSNTATDLLRLLNKPLSSTSDKPMSSASGEYPKTYLWYFLYSFIVMKSSRKSRESEMPQIIILSLDSG